ncbi:MAG: hybrid sensor histidine kinase/response regulator [Bacteroidia bacterium]
MKYKILIADDERSYLQQMISILNQAEEEFSVYCAPNGVIACEIALDVEPHLIITDWVMPEMDGLETLNFLKNHERTAEIPVLMITGLTSPEKLQQAFAAGAIDFITKPFEETEILARIRSVLLTNLKTNYYHQKVLDQKQNIERVNRELEKFIYCSSHDINGPVASGQGLLELMSTAEKFEEVKGYFPLLNSIFDRMHLIVIGLTRFGEIRKKVIVHEQLQLDTMIRSLVYSEEKEQEHSAELFLDLREQQILSDQFLFNEILKPLIRNSFMYFKGPDPMEIHISIFREEDQYIMTYRDNGPGFEEKLNEHVLEMFSKCTSSTTGLGLGLYLARTAIQKLKGTLKAKGNPGRGAEFTVSFPVIKTAQLEPEEMKVFSLRA